MKDLELEELVKEEATNLKQFATKEELHKLNEKMFDPDNPMYCIYGMATGYCFSERAHELIASCAKRVYNKGLDENDMIKGATLNGAPILAKPERENRHYFSPIEIFIILDNEKNPDEISDNSKALIAYLKDETQTLEFV